MFVTKLGSFYIINLLIDCFFEESNIEGHMETFLSIWAVLQIKNSKYIYIYISIKGLELKLLING